VRDSIEVHSERVDVHLRRLGPVVGPPVLLVPGLGAAPEIFSMHPDRPLTTMLSEAGRTPWGIDFQMSWRRGSQDAGSLVHALEVALAELRREHDCLTEEVDAIGHSLGAMLLLAMAVDGATFRSLVVMASGVDFRQGSSTLRGVTKLVPIGRLLARLGPGRRGIPVEGLARHTARIYGRRVRLSFELDQFHPGTTDGAVIRRFMATAVRDLSIPLLLELATLFTERGLHLGAVDRPLREAVRDLALPVLVIAGRQDRTCPVEASIDVAHRIPGAELILLGDEGPGYGHLDLLSGHQAPAEVLRPVVDFIRTNRPETP
jgi:pimeloyl-ACP methyl ester carboxylesterase